MKKILFLRSLEIPVENIRYYQQGKLDLHSLIKQQKKKVEEKRVKSEEVVALCQMLMDKENVKYDQLSFLIDLSLPHTITSEQSLNYPYLYEVATTGCFFLFQIFFTLSVYFLLPESIPVHWVGLIVIKTQPRLYIFAYIFITLLFLIALRSKTIFIYYSYTFTHRDYFRAMLSNFFIGLFLSMQVYIVYATQGLRLSQDVFILSWLGVQSLLWIIGTLFLSQYLKHKRSKEEG